MRRIAICHGSVAAFLLLAIGLVSAFGAMLRPAAAAKAQAALPPLTISVLISSRDDRCYDTGFVEAIKHLSNVEAERINASPAYGRRPYKLEFLDDRRDPERAIANMRAALANPSSIAVLGLSNSTIAKTMFDTLGKDISSSGVPFISDLSVTSLIADYGNVFSTRASQDSDSVPVLRRFLKDTGAQRPAFIGLKDALFSTALLEALKGGGDMTPLVAEHRLAVKDNQLDPDMVTAAIRDLKEKDADFLFLSIGAARTGSILQKMMAVGLRPPVLISGRIDMVLAATPDLTYGNDLHHLAFDGLPEAFNERLRQRIADGEPQSWNFEGKRNASAPGWAKGECKPLPSAGGAPDVLRNANLRAIGFGTQYGDMISLIADAVRTAPADFDVAKLRRHVTQQLLTTYADGQGTFRGNFENWSFNPSTRSATRTPLVVTLKASQQSMQLAPTQYVRLRNDALRPVQTLYLDVDMIRTFRVDDNEKSFFADFYLSMHHEGGASLDKVEFANAFLDPQTNSRQISVRTLHDGGQSATYPADMKIYRVTGKFMFEPRLTNYPFDTQRFSIDLQPKLGDAPFIVQPPPSRLRDQKIDADGWDKLDQYVGYDEDFIPLIDAKSREQSVVPFYKGSFVWIMRRQANDYYQRVVVPLGFILAVAYLSIFIPRTHFEAVITIQVTALLSAVALYLALPKIDSDTATFSDRIFLFVYLAVSVMIAISIARVNPFMKRPVGHRLLVALHVLGIPLMVAVMAVFVYGASQGNGQPWLAAWKMLTGAS